MAKKTRTIYDVDKDIAKKNYDIRILEIEREQLNFIHEAAKELLKDKGSGASAIGFRLDTEYED